MPEILIISSSIRDKRASHRVALFFEKYITEHNLGNATIVDLQALNFPLFTERLQYLQDPGEAVTGFSQSVKKADGVIIISPEYNGGYPASLKNVMDLLFPEWYRKPIALCSVSSGPFGASQVIMQLAHVFWKMRALLVPSRFQVASVQTAYNEDGTPTNAEASNKAAESFFKELSWCMEITSGKK